MSDGGEGARFETAPELMAQVFEWLRGSYIVLAVDVGIRSGAWDTLRRLERGTAEEIAEAGGLSPRHVREWLAVLTTSRLVRYDPVTATYAAAPGLLAARFPPGPPATVAFAALAPAVAETMKTGGGLSYADYGPSFVEMLDNGSRMATDLFLLDAWIPCVDGLRDSLAAGVSVAEIGCGTGHATNVLARAHPASRFVGFDINAEALRRGDAEAREWSLDNVTFERRDVVSLPDDGAYDVILAFDCIHDQAHPRRVLAEVRRALKPDGVFVMVEPRTSSNLEDNLDDPHATYHYVVSLFHCMQVSLAEGGEGLGTAWGEQRARELLDEAGLEVRAVGDVPGTLMPQRLFVASPR